jgi:ribosomal protein RSM22 (predicted rRNA methylase)
VADAVWRADDLRTAGDLGGPFDLVTAAYLLSEIPEAGRAALVDTLWRATGGLLVIVDAGSRAGHARILATRDRLLARGAHIVGPCPHAGPCPLAKGPDWCHVAVRLPRSRLHMHVKDVDRPYEDEPHAWLAVARTAPEGAVAGRLLRSPETTKAATVLTLCTPAGVERRTVAKREKAAFRAVSRLGWGDAVSDFATGGGRLA